MKKQQTKHPDNLVMFDILFETLSNGVTADRAEIEKYVVTRKRHGSRVAAATYPRVHNIVIEDEFTRNVWNDFLNTIDTL